MSMLKKRRKRGKEKATEFILHGHRVPTPNIDRYENRMLKHRKITESDTFSNIGTPRSLICRTPTPVNVTLSPTLEFLSFPSTPIGTEELSAPGCHSPFISPNTTTASPHSEIPLQSQIPHADCVTSQGTVSAAMQMNITHDQYSRSPSLPGFLDECISLSCHSPGLMTHPTPRSLGITHSPTFNISNWNQLSASTWISEFLGSPKLYQSPSCSNTDWWPAYSRYSSSPYEVRFIPPASHELEELIRANGRPIPNYQDQKVLDFWITNTRALCTDSCRYCHYYGFETAHSKCALLRCLMRLRAERANVKVGPGTTEKLFTGALYELCSTIDPTPLYLLVIALHLLWLEVRLRGGREEDDLSATILAYATSFLDPSHFGRQGCNGWMRPRFLYLQKEERIDSDVKVGS
ncbi:hypothetical protein K469DRAFT_94555 [Zopfia rhizophila CBS 207.26]|uniref:Uncharacterized protein n=1 Tax=Zopfia rhizophila CBS 207.26 TaxID=1314779 RepID=A0A6A6EBC3_9PEZI|nr:hypothetical protein K469DRAFT_94555 [Zopfia rhizophila CBS 207.26]